MKLKPIILLLVVFCCLVSSSHSVEAKWWGIIFDYPLIKAVQHGDEARVKRYLKRGADPNSHIRSYYSCLEHASTAGETNIAKLLIEYGARVNFSGPQISDQDTPLLSAAANGHLSTVQLLIDKGANVKDVVGTSNYTPLHFAAIHGNLKMSEVLIENQANVNAKNDYGNTPLHYAAERGQLKIVQLLVKHGADYRVTNKKNKRALHRAYKWSEHKGDFDCYNYLAKLEGRPICCPNSCCQKQNRP